MPLVVDAGATVPAEVERVLHHLGVVARERNDRSGVWVVVDDFAESVGSKELVIVVKALVYLDGQAVIDGIGTALEFLNARKASNGSWRLSDVVHCGSLSRSHKSDGYGRFGPLEINVAGAREMCALHPQIVNLNRHAGLNLVFEAQVGLLHVGLVIIGLENEDGRSACGATNRPGTARRCDWRAALSGGIFRDVCARKVEGLHVQGIVREGRADGDGGSPAVENSVARTNDQLLAERRPSNAESGTEVSMIVVNPVGEDSRSGEAGTGVEHRRLRDLVDENIHARLDGVTSADKRDCIANLAAMNAGEARAEEVSPYGKNRESSLANSGLRIVAVGLPGFVVAGIASACNVHNPGRNGGSD